MRAGSREPRPLAIVRFKHEHHTKENIEKYYKPLIGKQFIFLGEFPNQPGHCLLAEIGPRPEYPLTLKPFHHTADFEEVPEDDL